MSALAERLGALQRGLPLCARPFDVLAHETGCTPSDLFEAIESCRTQGSYRRFGAVFDTRRLGYQSALCAAKIPEPFLAETVSHLTPLVGVTHCYARTSATQTHEAQTFPNVWWTLSYPQEIFPALCDEVCARVKPFSVSILPALVRYKIDVVLGGTARAAEEQVDDTTPRLRAHERALIGAIQGDTEICPNYFEAIAQRLGWKEWDVLAHLELFKRQGRLRRIGLLLKHRVAGWTHNGMCCWDVSGDTHAAGHALSACATVTHCYARARTASFPFNLYAMIHARSAEEAHRQYHALKEVVDATCAHSVPSVMLLSTHEYKKTSMTFFASKDGQ